MLAANIKGRMSVNQDSKVKIVVQNTSPTYSYSLFFLDQDYNQVEQAYEDPSGQSTPWTVRLLSDLPNGTRVPYTITGISLNDVSIYSDGVTENTQLTGYFIIQDGSADNGFYITEDLSTEGPETMVITLDGITPTVSAALVVNDTSLTPLSPNYSLWVNSLTANETNANTITFYVSSKNIQSSNLPMTIPFKVIGDVNESDFLVGTQLSGTFTIANNNTVASQTFEVLADCLTEGNQTMTLILTSVAGINCPSEAETFSESVLIYDSSLFPPVYTLSITPILANETTNAVFDVKLTTVGVANGTQIPFVMSGVGISAVDFTGVSALTGVFQVAGATVPPDLTPVVMTQTYSLTADNLTEGTESLTITLSSAGGISCPVEAQDLSKQISIYDTSLTPVPTYTLTRSAASVDEGQSVTITLSTTNVANGTSVPYTVTGINQADLSSGSVSGNFTINSNTSTQVFTFANDQTTEGTETAVITLTLDNGSASISLNVNDTSTGAVFEGVPSLLLQGNGTNGSNNNTFIDSSSNNFAITRVGNATQGSFSPFPLASNTAYNPAVNSGSMYFDGAGDYLTVPGNVAAFGTGDFTVEFWCNFTSFSLDGTRARRILSHGINADNKIQVWIDNVEAYSNPAGGITLGISTPAISIGGTRTAVNDGAWHHIAFIRQSGTVHTYLDGVLTSSIANSTDFNDTTSLLKVGSYDTNNGNYLGYVSNLRIVNGAAVYTSNFTPPTAPLTNITNTQLLLNGTNGGIIDGAAKNDVTTYGNTQISTSIKKYGSGSMYFDGSGDYLTVPGNVAAFGTGDFTVEFWCNFTTISQDGANARRILAHGASASNRIQVWIDDVAAYSNPAGGISLGISTPAISIGGTRTAVNDGAWHHIAFVKQSGIVYTYLDGVLKSSIANSTNFNDTTSLLKVGSYDTTNGNYLGYIDDLRIVKGTAVYTSNFTPPTQALPNSWS